MIHGNTEQAVRQALTSPLTMIASDGVLENGVGHPRNAGTYARVLGRYVRQDRLLPLMDALRKMTLMPAQRLEARVPAMKNKGRIRISADADVPSSTRTGSSTGLPTASRRRRRPGFSSCL